MAERGLLNPAEMVERRAQSVDLAVAGLDRGIDRRLSDAALRLSNSAARLRPPNSAPKLVRHWPALAGACHR